MKSRGLTVILFLFLVLLLLSGRAGAQTSGPHIQLLVDGVIVYDSGGAQPTAIPPTPTVIVEPTAEPTVVPPTATAIPPTATSVPPTPVLPTPTATAIPPGQPGEPYPGAPACTSHNDRRGHGLWDAMNGCHYDHHHGDDFRELDYKLSTQIYDLMGGEISYPWQTVGDAGYENDLKHAGYIRYVRDNIPCTDPAEPCITAFRIQVHQHTLHDASVRFHSYVMEGQTSDGGYFLLSGWMDFGDLHAPEGTIVANVEGNHCGSQSNPGNHKQHAVEGGSRAPSNIWYGRSRTNSDVSVDGSCGYAVIGTSAQDPWIWASQEAPTFMGDWVCFGNLRCRNNATTYRPHLVGVADIRDFPFIYQDGVANFEGWADRYGVPYADGGGCTGPSIDCAPFILRGLAFGQSYGTNASATANSYRDYDVYFPDANGRLQTSGWSQPVP